ncbi:phosphodiester glycosidase family protein [Flavobacterium sp.]|uniref:phosphodiester glycosidase family protein n=1 Tax=Flavobacterium sp. TaxID=239 RepID=UPI00260A11F8|nr:phosphodiester glycosidase family protein [Flavobacterium sp.]
MKNKFLIVLFFVISVSLFFQFSTKSDNDFVTYSVNTSKSKLSFYWKNNDHEIFGSIDKLRNWLSKNNNQLIFATNGGMYKKDQSPQGLFIENGIEKTPIDTSNAKGNFYMKPNGIFYLTNSNKAFVCKTEDFHNDKSIKFATQSGPMLVIDGQIHNAFNKKSTNLNIRNGVGILPNNEVLFAMSKKEINFYEFADFFKSKGCKNALYLDGFVSRTYCPKENWEQIDGNFGVIIAVTKN